MKQDISAAHTGGPAAMPAPSSTSGRIGWRLFRDRQARRLVTFGGSAIILAILAIFAVITMETVPLFRPPTLQPVPTATPPLAAPVLALGCDEYLETVYAITPAGMALHRQSDGSPIPTPPLELGNASISGVASIGPDRHILGLTDGRALPVEISFSVTYPDGQRRVEPALKLSGTLTLDASGRPIRALAAARGERDLVIASSSARADLQVTRFRARVSLDGSGVSYVEGGRHIVPLSLRGHVTTVAMDERGDDAFVGSSTGELVRVDLRDSKAPKAVAGGSDAPASGVPITRMGFLLGQRSLIVGDGAGGVSSWMLVQTDDAPRLLKRVRTFDTHPGPIAAFTPCRRNRGFVTADRSGRLALHYGTTGRTLLQAEGGDRGIQALCYAPKANGLLAVAGDGRLLRWALDNPHPEITLQSLFGKVWYEGYPEPTHVWQSTGATDDFESKFSLTPLIFGTLKGTLYALLFAVPIAILAAAYTSQFMHPTIKAWVKPSVEIMAALPSVVLGFIAGSWLAPWIERFIPGLLLSPAVLAGLLVLGAALWRATPAPARARFKVGAELILIVPIVLLGLWLSLKLGGWAESALLGDDYRRWALSALGVTFDQRNSVVVGIAMGFAVIPLIFTIAEDSLSNVPGHLSAGSLALGATPWQTVVRVVLPAASPGIFSAVMIGFGRAVGETMIVLMATGNTPVMEWSAFNGFRALSANIAVELPEADEGGTLFRVLFLAAFMLFVMTFLLNTVAEIVRLRLRRRYNLL